MEAEKEKQGCLSVLLGLFPWLGERTLKPAALPYARRDDFLSPAEHSFYSVLTNMLGEHFTVCPKVSLSDVFYINPRKVPAGEKPISYRNRIDRKHVDFLICTPKTMIPVLGIELDDKSHRRVDRQVRDAFVDSVFTAAGLPLLHVPAAASYNTRELAILLRPHLEPVREVGRTLQKGDPGAAAAEEPVEAADSASLGGSAKPACPKCGGEMVLRTASRGTHAGKQFWGCENYPQCRGVIPIVNKDADEGQADSG